MTKAQRIPTSDSRQWTKPAPKVTAPVPPVTGWARQGAEGAARRDQLRRQQLARMNMSNKRRRR